ncbi:MAG TPA: hypothetical protein ENH82_08805 [bacterium]|nr:hypothetical protein [bacterium]
MKGKISKIIRGRSFGFIDAEDGQEVFFHRSALEGIDFNEEMYWIASSKSCSQVFFSDYQTIVRKR